jgi:aminobenzoyl-glutamate utilization protein B
LDVLTDAELRRAARDDLARRTAGHTYVSPLPPEQTRPSTLPDWLLGDGTTEAVANITQGSKARGAAG